ncbi:hypothetical protein AOLI_G00098550 [Acnodon oligacanthus]
MLRFDRARRLIKSRGGSVFVYMQRFLPIRLKTAGLQIQTEPRSGGWWGGGLKLRMVEMRERQRSRQCLKTTCT